MHPTAFGGGVLKSRAAYFYKTNYIKDIEKDFEETLEKCRKVTKENIWGKYKLLKPIAFFLKIIAPLL